MKWSPDGATIATVSENGIAKLIDFVTGKVIYAGKMPDQCILILLLPSIHDVIF